MVSWDRADVDEVLLLAPRQNGFKGVFFLELFQKLLRVLVDLVHADCVSVLVENAPEFRWISEEIVLHDILNETIEDVLLDFIADIGLTNDLQWNLR